MAKVCVVGGGRAGREAAREAEGRGADVTVVEMQRMQPLPWKEWPSLISSPDRCRPCDASGSLRHWGRLSSGAEVVSVAPGLAKTREGAVFRADAMVVATGSGFEAPAFQGRGKTGVTVLDSPESYSELGRSAASAERVTVTGEWGRGIEVSERLARRGAKVSFLVSSWQHEAPSAEAMGAIAAAAMDKGVGISAGRVSRALGVGRAEAVLVDGRVILTNALAVVPRRIPRPPTYEAQIGPGGGIAVDRSMRTNLPGVLAAGSCAEVSRTAHRGRPVDDEPLMSGRIAGANSTGGNFRLGSERAVGVSAFGVRWVMSGESLRSATASGMDAALVSHRWGPRSACSLVYEKRKGMVVGIELVHDLRSLPPSLPSPASGSESLESYAYGCSGPSSDISMVSETARLGLQSWSRS